MNQAKGSVTDLNRQRQLPVPRVSVSAAYESGLFPENAAGVMTAPVGSSSSIHPRVLRGGEQAVHVQHRQEGEEDAQEKCVEIASHLAFQASHAGHFCCHLKYQQVREVKPKQEKL